MSKYRGLPVDERLRLQSEDDPTTGCRNWTGSKDKNGYGYVKHHGKTTKAHRVSYEVCHGPFDQNLWVLHSCDNPSCINPSHLFLGTALDNTRDMLSKGRQRMEGRNSPVNGESNPNAILTRETAAAIRREYSWGKGPMLSKKYGVCVSQIRRVAKGRVWNE